MTEKKIIIANWKCNPTSKEEAVHLLKITKEVKIKQTDIILCIPFIWLGLASNMTSKFLFGSQDCFWEEKGPYTGEVSAPMLKSIGCRYSIVGHSERKKYFNETDEIINKKVRSLLKSRINPILCVGEEVRDSFTSSGRPINELSLIVREQLEKALDGVSSERAKDIIFTYEPVWAISTQEGASPCLPDDAMKACLFIRKILSNIYDRKTAERAKVIYGGSVDSKNVLEYIIKGRMDGVLVGGASLKASEFIKIIKKAEG